MRGVNDIESCLETIKGWANLEERYHALTGVRKKFQDILSDYSKGVEKNTRAAVLCRLYVIENAEKATAK